MNSTTHFNHSVSRRRFLRNVTASLATLPLAQALNSESTSAATTPLATGLVGTNIFGWGQYYQRDGKNVNDHLDEVCTILHDLGYDYLEGNLDTNQPENNLRLAERMVGKGLKAVCLYTGGKLHDAATYTATVRKILIAAQISLKAGFKIIDCNPDPIGREKTDAELSTQAKALNELGIGLKALGMSLGVHNHTPEMANHAREFHHIFRNTDVGAVGLCYDVHWVYRGGISPDECLKLYGTRVVSWHLRQSRNQIWWEDLDSGDIDYGVVAKFANEHRLPAPYTVELAIEKGTNITRSVVENHRRSREYVRKVFGV